MSRGREVGDEEVDEEEMESYEFDEGDYVEEQEDFFFYGEFIDAINRNSIIAPWILCGEPPPLKIRKCDAHLDLDLKLMLSSGGYGGLDSPLDIKPQDADYSNLPQLSDDLETMFLSRIPIELEFMILARIPIIELRKLCFLNKRFLALVKSRELLKERRRIGVKEAYVFMLASGEENWWAFDQKFTSHKALPIWPSDDMFKLSDKESLCAGTHLLVCGVEFDGPVIWTYEVITNKWYKGQPMIEPRCLFASASCGDFAYVAGGFGLESNEILNSAEKYDPESKSWTPLPKMKERRKMCSGFYMDDKFYVIGGQNQHGYALTCGEVFHEDKNTWTKIPGMLNGLTRGTSQSPPLVAVVNNELYTIESCSNRLMVYLKESNSWKNLGPIPVQADKTEGWGVAFKSLGNELLVIGGSTISLSGRGMTIHTCCPNPNEKELNWKLLDGGGSSRSHFIKNCTVMVA